MSEIDGKRADKTGIMNVPAVIHKLTGLAREGKVKTLVAVWLDDEGEVMVGYSTGNVLEHIGLVEVARNDLLADVLGIGDE